MTDPLTTLSRFLDGFESGVKVVTTVSVPEARRAVESLRADLAGVRFSEREWRDKAQDKIAEVEGLLDAVERLNGLVESADDSMVKMSDELVVSRAEVEKLEAEKAGFDELMTLRANAERTLLAEVVSLRAERERAKELLRMFIEGGDA